MRRTLTTMLASIAVAAPMTLGVASSASAACPEAGQIYFIIGPATASSKMTNLRSAYLQGPGTITYNQTRSATVTATMSTKVSAEAGVIFAKASTELGVSVGKSWSKAGTWTYAKPVPSGKTARLVMYHETRRFRVTKRSISGATCQATTLWSETVTAPRTHGYNVWRLNYL